MASVDESRARPARQGTAALVTDQIREGIKSGRFSPGHRLVEAELTREFGVSRGPVREALSRLEAEGLVEIAPHRGASVRQMTRRDVAELFTAREILEGGAARLAAEHIDEGDHRRRLKKELTENRRWSKTTDIRDYVEINTRFHNLVVEIADNRLMADLIAQLQTHIYRVLFLDFLSVDGVRRSSLQHVKIAEAILAGDGRAAESLMRKHIHRTADETLAREHPLFRP